MEKQRGKPHIISSTVNEISRFFTDFGYTIASGPELETEYYNFNALNIPQHHPSREMQDTFWIKGEEGKLLRTHTSSVQVRYAEKNNPPIKIIVPGKVFRNEATDAHHEVQFFQLEGLYIDKDVSLADLKGTLTTFLQVMFGDSVEVRFRQSYFPFTEPSLEVDIKQKGGDWLEVLGCGMVHRHVLTHMNIDPEVYQGFAFGLGLDRIISLRYNIDDIRLLYKGDLRLTKQF